MDELGRGTSVDEGIAIAYNVLDHIHTHIRCKTLFATHYKPVTDLARITKHMLNFKMGAIPTATSLLLSYQLEPGVSDQSYGLFVAKMAGIPESILNNCKEYLKREQNEADRRICSELRALDLNQMSPIQCFAYLHKLQGIVNGTIRSEEITSNLSEVEHK